MTKNVNLRPKELFYFIIVTFPPLLLLFIPNYAAIYIGIDAWAIFAAIAVIDLIFAGIIIKMGLICPDKSVIGMSRYAFGENVGTVFGAFFVVLFGLKSVMFFRQSLEYVFISTYTLEPIYYFAIPMILVLVYGQICGTNVIIRLSNIVFWLMAATYFIITLAAVRNFEVSNLMPFFVDGVLDVAKAVPRFFTWCGNSVILLMLWKNTDLKKGVTKHVMTALFASYAVIIALNVLFIGVFGIIAGFMTTSVLELSLFLSKQVFFNNFDSVIKLIWIFGAFIRDSIFISCTASAFAELLRVKKNKLLKLIVSLLLSVPPILIFRNEEIYFMAGMGISSVISGIIQYGCVLLLFVGLLIKKRQSNSKRTEKEAAI